MGLDVYVYRYDSKEQAEEYDAAVAKRQANESISLDDYPDDPGESIEHDSKIHPEHMFKIGYWRSSYNSGGINYVLNNSIGKDLYWIVEPGDNEYIIEPNWEMWLERAKQVRNEYAAFLDTDTGKYTVIRTSHSIFVANEDGYNKMTDTEAIDLYLKNKAKEGPMTWFDSREGTFFMNDKPTVHAAIHTISPLGGPETILVIDKPKSMLEKPDWYLQALDIVIETCQWMLNHNDDGYYRISWSA